MFRLIQLFAVGLFLITPVSHAETTQINQTNSHSTLNPVNTHDYALSSNHSPLSVSETLQNTQNAQVENMMINQKPKLSEVSEPSTLGLMFGGLGLAGLIAYKSQKQDTE